MSKFEILFGVKESEIKNNCILAPYLSKRILSALGVKKILRGKLYSVGQGENFSLIHTAIGPAFCGDAVLYLKETKVKNLILFGSCGLVKAIGDLNIGSLVSPYKTYCLESFSELLDGTPNFKVQYADKDLLADCLQFSKEQVKQVICATVGSLKLEEENESIRSFAEVVDMECSAFFSAANHIKRKAIAIFYISDIVNHKPFYLGLGQKEKLALRSSIAKSTELLCGFTKTKMLNP